MRIPLLAVASLLCVAAGAQTVTSRMRAAMNAIDTLTIRSHIAYLADDRLQGRLPGTEGFRMAADYVVDQFRSMGVRPAGDEGSFLQRLIIRKSTLDNASAYAVIRDDRGNRDSLTLFKEFTAVPHPMKATTAAEGKLVFVGYGLEVPGVYSDYAGVDVQGKIAVMVAGAPEGFSSTINAHFRHAGSKYELAARRGAKGVILITVPRFPVVSSAQTIQANATMNPEKTMVASNGFNGGLDLALNGTTGLLHRLFFGSGKSVDEVLAKIRSKQPASFELPYSLSAGYGSTHTDIESFNVVGLIPGSDKKLKNEYVVHSAHLDHLGVGKPVNGDSIYNGAHDNASGVASLLEIARLYQRSGARPRRSILVILVTGEEMGLIGSAYFAAHPTVPRPSIVADVNTDMPTVIAPLLSIVPLGAEHSTLMSPVRFAAGQLGLEIEADPEPNEFRFTRSDQYSFVRQGIPALHIKYGIKTNVPGFDMVSFVKQWREKHYHKPADELNGTFNFAAAKTYVQLNFLISYAIAQTTERPQWNPGDLFGVSTGKGASAESGAR